MGDIPSDVYEIRKAIYGANAREPIAESIELLRTAVQDRGSVIPTKVAIIRQAIYGEDVRQAIADCIEILNELIEEGGGGGGGSKCRRVIVTEIITARSHWTAEEGQ